MNPLTYCWNSEEGLDANDITELLATCRADMILTDNLHLLILCTADSSALPVHLLPSSHATYRMDVRPAPHCTVYNLQVLLWLLGLYGCAQGSNTWHVLQEFLLEGTSDDADGTDQYDAVLLCGGFKGVEEPKEALKRVRMHLHHIQHLRLRI